MFAPFLRRLLLLPQYRCIACGRRKNPSFLRQLLRISAQRRPFCSGVRIEEVRVPRQHKKVAKGQQSQDEVERTEQAYTQLRQAYGLTALSSDARAVQQRVLLVHPRVRGVPLKDTTTSQQVEEAVTLCESMPGACRIVSNIVVQTDEAMLRKKLMWGAGRLNAIMDWLQQHPATAMFINIDILSPLQQRELSTFFGLPVYDRYTIVLSIFKLYARTREARLQISLAELPYLRERVRFHDVSKAGQKPDESVEFSSAAVDSMPIIGSSDSTRRLELLRLREHALRKQIRAATEALARDVQTMRDAWSSSSAAKMVIVGIIGYTNAGKTSLIKTLTDEESLCGEDRPFATLDSTLHQALLPSRNKILLADTIGFISNLPVKLFAAFSATLQHIESADLLIHVIDLSNRDVLAQRDQVMATLKELGIRQNLRDGIITVGNKLDKCDPARIEWLRKKALLPPSDEALAEDTSMSGLFPVPISCRTADGLPTLIQRMDKSVQHLTGSRKRRFKLAPGSAAIPYLYSEGLVPAEGPSPSDCGQFLVFNMAMSDAQLARFQAAMGTAKMRLKRRSEKEGEGRTVNE